MCVCVYVRVWAVCVCVSVCDRWVCLCAGRNGGWELVKEGEDRRWKRMYVRIILVRLDNVRIAKHFRMMMSQWWWVGTWVWQRLMVSSSSWPVVAPLEQLRTFFFVLHHESHSIGLCDVCCIVSTCLRCSFIAVLCCGPSCCQADVML